MRENLFWNTALIRRRVRDPQLEALLMQFFLELIKEAGLRLPGPLAQTFGIVGGLILGDVGIRAGLVSEAMVITVAATAIASFSSVDREMGTVLRLLGFPVMLSAAVFGLYGLTMAFIIIHCWERALSFYISYSGSRMLGSFCKLKVTYSFATCCQKPPPPP